MSFVSNSIVFNYTGNVVSVVNHRDAYYSSYTHVFHITVAVSDSAKGEEKC